MDALSWFALGVIIFVVLVIVYGVIAIHDIPYRIAKARNHPHQEAIHAGGWISLLTLHAIWPFLWIWAYAYDPRYGYSGRESSREVDETGNRNLETINQRLGELESELAEIRSTLGNQSKTRAD